MGKRVTERIGVRMIPLLPLACERTELNTSICEIETRVKRIHIIGRKNNGKTTLVTDLVQALGKRGLRVGTIKGRFRRTMIK